MKQILESLVFDGFAVRLHTLGEGGKKVTFYRAIKNQPLTSGEKWGSTSFLINILNILILTGNVYS